MLLLDARKPRELESYLATRGWIDAPLTAVETAGEGNMNLVLRARGTRRSVIVKQSRGWVEKYPDIEAPEDRICAEVAFYRAVAHTPGLAARMPTLIAFDEANRIALFEDLGEAADFTDVYAGREIDNDTMEGLWSWLSELHALRPDAASMPRLENRAMRILNHAHIFEIPLQHENGLDLDAITPGLAEHASALRDDADYCETVRSYGARYLENGTTLLHGDYYPGSWVESPAGVKIIDPEFAFFGPAEFDYGVFVAHLHLAGLSSAAVSDAARTYRQGREFAYGAARAFAGIEIMRRLIGVAQLSLSADLARKRELLALSRELVLSR